MKPGWGPSYLGVREHPAAASLQTLGSWPPGTTSTSPPTRGSARGILLPGHVPRLALLPRDWPRGPRAERPRLRVPKGRAPWEDWFPGATGTRRGCHTGLEAPETAVGAATVRCGAVQRGAARREARQPQPQAALPRQAAPWANAGDPGESDPLPHLRIPRAPRRGHQPALEKLGYLSRASGPRTATD